MDSQLIQKWMKSCRLCLMDDGVKLPIFGEEGIVREVAHKIETCFPIVIYNADPLSKIICQRCLFMLDTVYNFRQKCVETNNEFTSHLSGLKSNSSSVKQYLQTLEKSGTHQNANKTRDIHLSSLSRPGSASESRHALQYTPPVRTPQRNSTSGSTESLEMNSSLNHSVQAHEHNIIPPIRIKKEKDIVCPLKAVPKIISVVGSYSDSSSLSTAQQKDPTENVAGIEKLARGPVKREYNSVNRPRKAREGQRLRSPWLCEYCNKYYKSKQTLWKHQKYFCTGECYHCGRCNQMFNTDKERMQHWSTHLRVFAFLRDEQLSSCSTCDKKFSSNTMLKNHLKVHQAQDSMQTHDVSEAGPSHHMSGHLREVVPVRSVPVTKTKSKNGHLRSKFQCEYCPNFYTRKDNLNFHKRVHHWQQMYTPIHFSSSAKPIALQEADASPIKPKYRPAPLSKQKALPQPKNSGLLRSMLLQNLKCEICFKVFMKKSSLTNHLRSHSINANVNRCLVCDRLFGSKKGLAYHMTIKHRDNANSVDCHQCKHCNRTFNFKSEMLRHSLVHEKKTKKDKNPTDQVGPLLCSYCNQVFYNSLELKDHLLTHKIVNNSPDKPIVDPEKTLTCKTCGKMFSTKRNVMRHEKIHLIKGNNCISCDVCGRKFLSKTYAAKHAATHLISKTYHCPGCNKIFFKPEALQNHSCTSNSSANEESLTGQPNGEWDAGQSLAEPQSTVLCKMCGCISLKGHVCKSIGFSLAPRSIPKAKSKNAYKSYKCKYCSQVFMSSYSHNSHMKVHASANRRLILKVPNVTPEPVIKAEPLDEPSVMEEPLPGPQSQESVTDVLLNIWNVANETAVVAALSEPTVLPVQSAVNVVAEAVDAVDDVAVAPDAVADAPDAVDAVPDAVDDNPDTVDDAPDAVDDVPDEVDDAPDTVVNNTIVERDNLHKCSICSKMFHSQYSLDLHIPSHEEDAVPKSFRCPLCSMEHETGTYLNDHIAASHPDMAGVYHF